MQVPKWMLRQRGCAKLSGCVLFFLPAFAAWTSIIFSFFCLSQTGPFAHHCHFSHVIIGEAMTFRQSAYKLSDFQVRFSFPHALFYFHNQLDPRSHEELVLGDGRSKWSMLRWHRFSRLFRSATQVHCCLIHTVNDEFVILRNYSLPFSYSNVMWESLQTTTMQARPFQFFKIFFAV